MRTVDVLIAARDLLSNRQNWTTGELGWRRSENDSCFCALGATLVSGGCLVPPAKPFNNAWRTPDAALGIFEVSATHGLSGAGTNGPQVAERLSQAVLRSLDGSGVYLRATAGAIKYLSSAVIHEANGITLKVYEANDNEGYDFIMRAFNRAIRNAKRRHINGDRAKAQVSA